MKQRVLSGMRPTGALHLGHAPGEEMDGDAELVPEAAEDLGHVHVIAAESLAVMSELHNHRLLRFSTGTDREEVETYHDRVRESVVQSLSRAALAERTE